MSQTEHDRLNYPIIIPLADNVRLVQSIVYISGHRRWYIQKRDHNDARGWSSRGTMRHSLPDEDGVTHYGKLTALEAMAASLISGVQ